MNAPLIPLINIPAAASSSSSTTPRDTPVAAIKELHAPRILFDLSSGVLHEVLFLLKLENYAQLAAGTEVEFGLMKDVDLGSDYSTGRWVLTVAKNDMIEDELGFQIQYRDAVLKDSVHLEIDCSLDGQKKMYSKDLCFVDGARMRIKSPEDIAIATIKFDNGCKRRNVIEGGIVVRLSLVFLECSYSRAFTFGSTSYLTTFLQQRTQQLWDTREFCDFQLFSSNHEEFPVHRCILAAASPVFCAMFSTNMVEKQNGCATLKDIDSSALKALLKFIYGIDISQDLPVVCEAVLKAADEYQINELRAMCLEYLSGKVTAQTAIRYLLLADQFCDVNLKNAALKYIANNFTEFKEGDGMETLWRTDVPADIINQIVDHLGTKAEKRKKRSASQADLY